MITIKVYDFNKTPKSLLKCGDWVAFDNHLYEIIGTWVDGTIFAYEVILTDCSNYEIEDDIVCVLK